MFLRLNYIQVQVICQSFKFDNNHKYFFPKLNRSPRYLRNDFYLWLIILGIVLGLPFFGKLYEEHKEARKSSFTLDDVQELMKKLIEDNNVKLERKFQV